MFWLLMGWLHPTESWPFWNFCIFNHVFCQTSPTDFIGLHWKNGHIMKKSHLKLHVSKGWCFEKLWYLKTHESSHKCVLWEYPRMFNDIFMQFMCISHVWSLVPLTVQQHACYSWNLKKSVMHRAMAQFLPGTKRLLSFYLWNILFLNILNIVRN